jgi:PAS domain S-box-containing protein
VVVDSKDKKSGLLDQLGAARDRILNPRGARAAREANNKALRESEARYRSLHDNVPVGVFRMTVEDGGLILSGNPALAELLGYDSVDDVVGTRIVDHYADADDRRVFTEIISLKTAVYDYQVELKRADGEFFLGSLSARAVRSPDGFIAHIDGVLEDVSRSFRTEVARGLQRDATAAALKRFQYLQDEADVELWRRTSSAVRDLQSVLDHAGVLLWSIRTDEEGELVCERVNDTLADVSGKDPEFFTGKRVVDLVTPEQFKDIAKAYKSVVDGEPRTFNVRYGDGPEPRQYIVRIIPLAVGKGQGQRYICSATDVTELKKAEEGLRELQRANDTLTDLVVHDIKNISSTMFAWLELIRDGDLGPLTDDQVGALARIVERNEELVHLSEELLDIARAAEGKVVIEKKSYVLEDQLREVIKSVQPAAAKDGKRISRRVVGGPVVVQADEERVRRVWLNLLHNALRFVPARTGRVTITVRKDEKSGLAVVRVKDNGPGIPKEFQQIIFEKFRQVELKKSGMKKGTGLGLTFCKMVVEAHDGTIEAESDGKQGSVFIFTLPLYKPE